VLISVLCFLSFFLDKGTPLASSTAYKNFPFQYSTSLIIPAFSYYSSSTSFSNSPYEHSSSWVYEKLVVKWEFMEVIGSPESFSLVRKLDRIAP